MVSTYAHYDELEQPSPGMHLVEFYNADEATLRGNATKYLEEGLRLGSAVLLVASAEHGKAFLRSLELAGINPDLPLQDGRLVLLDSVETLARFMVDGHPNSERFEDIVGGKVRQTFSRSQNRELRVYGEMVGQLWKAKQFPAAIRLEQLWNKLQKSVPFSLLCVYPIDVFGDQFESGILDALLCAHTHLLPTENSEVLENALHRAMDEVLGSEGLVLRTQFESCLRPAWATLPRAEAIILCLRNKIPDRASDILARAARYYALPRETEIAQTAP